MNRREMLKISASVIAGAGFTQAEIVAQPAPSVADLPSRLVSTGFPTLDMALGGGFRPGSLALVLGPQGSWKSPFLRELMRTNGSRSDRQTIIGSGSDGVEPSGNDMLVLRKDANLLYLDFSDQVRIENLKKIALELRSAVVIAARAKEPDPWNPDKDLQKISIADVVLRFRGPYFDDKVVVGEMVKNRWGANCQFDFYPISNDQRLQEARYFIQDVDANGAVRIFNEVPIGSLREASTLAFHSDWHKIIPIPPGGRRQIWESRDPGRVLWETLPMPSGYIRIQS